MVNNKRVATKHIRDGIKSKYKRKCYCEICGSTTKPEFHHYSTVSLLLKSYADANGISIATDEAVLAMRDEFYELYSYELLENTVTLCKQHHAELHKTYGRTPPLHTATAQAEWVASYRDTEGIVDSEFIKKVEDANAKKTTKKKKKTTKEPKELVPSLELNTSGLDLYRLARRSLSDFKV